MSDDLIYNDNDFTGGRFQGDKGVHARFYTLPQKDEAKSEKKGRPIYEEKDYVEIVAAGNANNIVRRKATEEDKQRFARQYEVFCRAKNSDSEQLIGTPLTEVSWLTKSQVSEMAYFHIHTLEQLASVDDSACSRFAGLYDMKKRAKVMMEAAEKAAPLTEMQSQMEQMKIQLQALVEQNKELKQENEELVKSKK